MAEQLVGWDPGEAPRAEPLTYPGRWPPQSILLTRQDHFALALNHGRRLGQARVNLGHCRLPGGDHETAGSVPLNYALLRYNSARVDERFPVLAVGSNASPAQMRHKYDREGVSLVVPMALAKTEGLDVGVAADVAPKGYVPATPVLGPELCRHLFVQWLDPHQLAALDATETGYDRVLLESGTPENGGVRITLPSGEVLGACYAYVSRRGHLLDGAGPLLLGDQAELLRQLLTASPALSALLGDSASTWMNRILKPGMIEAVRQLFQDEGWVDQSEALTLTTEKAPDRTYGQILPATSAAPGSWRVQGTSEPVQRHGQAVVRVPAALAAELGDPEHVAVASVAAATHPDMAQLDALARLVVDEDPAAPADRIQVDQNIRDGLGLEVGEAATLRPVHVSRTHWSDRLIGAPTYVTCRVQLAEASTIEREVCLLDPLTLELLGIESGAEIIVEGRAGEDGEVEQIRIKAFATSEAAQQNRESLHGGDLSGRFPSACDSLGVHPDLPWIFLDTSSRWMLRLGRQRLATVRVRPSLAFQLRQELREMLLILGIAFIGLVEVITEPWARIGTVVAMVGVVAAAISVRMRGRLSSRMFRPRRLRRRTASR